MKTVHISQQRYDFIVGQGYGFKNGEMFFGDGGGVDVMEAPNSAIYHILADELAYCEGCQATCQSVDANSPSELETVKMFPLDKAIVALRNQRQSDILTIREHWTKCAFKSELESAVIEAAVKARRVGALEYSNADHFREIDILVWAVDELIASRAEDERDRRLNSEGAIRDAQEVKSRFETKGSSQDDLISEDRERVPREESK